MSKGAGDYFVLSFKRGMADRLRQRIDGKSVEVQACNSLADMGCKRPFGTMLVRMTAAEVFDFTLTEPGFHTGMRKLTSDEVRKIYPGPPV
ncbi:MAG: hypothetical protein AB7H77_02005 [Bdellovibrionales bacterium]